MNQPHTLVLASTSPRRREILDSLGFDFEVVPVDVDENPRNDEPPPDMVVRLAVAKAEAADRTGNAVVLAADTVVVVDRQVMGKPQDEAGCLAMLRCLSGRGHEVFTGVALRGPQGTRTALSATEVFFREIGSDEARAYWQSGEPADKAGAYAIQGRGGVFVERIAGSYSGVVGLPVFETATLLADAGLGVFSRPVPNDG